MLWIIGVGFCLTIALIFWIEYRVVRKREKDGGISKEFKNLFTSMTLKYPQNKRFRWNNAPAAIFWNDLSDQIMVVCKNSQEGETPVLELYDAFLFDVRMWSWLKDVPPGDTLGIEEEIEEIINKREGLQPYSFHQAGYRSSN